MTTTWKRFPNWWPFVRRTHQSPVNSPHGRSVIRNSDNRIGFLLAWTSCHTNTKFEMIWNVMTLIHMTYLTATACGETGYLIWLIDLYDLHMYVYYEHWTEYCGVLIWRLFGAIYFPWQQMHCNIWLSFRSIPLTCISPICINTAKFVRWLHAQTTRDTLDQTTWHPLLFHAPPSDLETVRLDFSYQLYIFPNSNIFTSNNILPVTLLNRNYGELYIYPRQHILLIVANRSKTKPGRSCLAKLSSKISSKNITPFWYKFH